MVLYRMMRLKTHSTTLILPIIVFSQFLCTSLWFAGNSIISDISRHLQLQPEFLAHITSAIQFGFISGTFVFAVFTISDRFSPSRVFFFSSILAAAFNLGITLPNIDTNEILLFRFLTGFFLAGIYPVGMKIAADHFQTGLGKSLGFLVGALVLGTAFPHLLKNLSPRFNWHSILYATSSLSVLGGICILVFVPDGPFRQAAKIFKAKAFLQGFKHPPFRAAAFGYFGHMWELYSFWAFVPTLLIQYQNRFPEVQINVSLFSFLIIASGGLACVLGGLLSQKFGTKNTAALALFLSCLCCLCSPLFLFTSSPILFFVFLFFWGLVVVADSPLFSTLVAQHAPAESKGSALTIVNCIGFFITILSIQFMNTLSSKINIQFLYMILAIGPALGLIALFNTKNNRNKLKSE